jgi:acyl carrier protein
MSVSLESIFTDVVAMIAGVESAVTIADITLDSDLYQDLGIDSLSRMDLLGEVERHYGITIADDDIPSLDKVGAVVSVVQRAVEGRPA